MKRIIFLENVGLVLSFILIAPTEAGAEKERKYFPDFSYGNPQNLEDAKTPVLDKYAEKAVRYYIAWGYDKPINMNRGVEIAARAKRIGFSASNKDAIAIGK